MIIVIFILVAGAVIVLVGAAAFALIVINIQITDRSKRLMQEPRNVLDAATRRLLGSCRHSSGLHRTKES